MILCGNDNSVLCGLVSYLYCVSASYLCDKISAIGKTMVTTTTIYKGCFDTKGETLINRHSRQITSSQRVTHHDKMNDFFPTFQLETKDRRRDMMSDVSAISTSISPSLTLNFFLSRNRTSSIQSGTLNSEPFQRVSQVDVQRHICI